jgi:hypothetical protein
MEALRVNLCKEDLLNFAILASFLNPKQINFGRGIPKLALFALRPEQVS